MRLLFRVTIIVISYLSLLSTASAGQLQAGAPQQKITIQLKWKHQFQFAGYYAAKEKGFYAEEGLDVSLRPRDAKENYVENVIEGKAEYGTADSGLLLYRARGKPVVLLKQIFQHSPLIFIAKKESGIVSPYEMIGKKVRFNPQDGNFAALTATLIETIKDPLRVSIVPQSYDLKSFLNGEVDVISAYLTSQPFNLTKLGVDFNIINPQNYGVDFYGDNLFTTDAEIKHHPKRVEKVVRATLKGWRYALEHKEELVDIILARYAPGEDREALLHEADMTERMILPGVIELGAVNPLRFRRIANMFARAGFSSRSDSLEGFFYHDRAANRSAAEKAWLAEHNTIRAGVIINGAPIAFLGPDGELQGLVADYLKKMESVLGVRFELVAGKRKELSNKVRNREIDLISDVQATELKMGLPLLYTDAFMAFAVGVFANDSVNFINDLELLNGRKVAVSRDSFLKDLLASRYPQIKIIPVADVREGLKRINSGKVFAYIDFSMTTYHVIQTEGYNQIHMVGETPFKADAAMAVSKDMPALQGILQHGFERIDPLVRNKLYDKWAPVIHIKAADYAWVWKTIGGIIALALFVIFWNRKLAAEVKKRTQNLKESEELFRKLFEDHSAVKLIIDPDTAEIIDANKAAEEYYGWPRSKLKEMRISDISMLSPDTVENDIKEAMAGRKSYLHLRHRLANGDIRDVAVLIGKINYKGKFVFHSVIHDITDQKTTEAALLKNEERLSMAIEATGAGIYDYAVPIDENTYHSPRWAEILGYKLDELPPCEHFLQWLNDNSHPEDQTAFKDAYDGFISGKNPNYDVEVRLRHKDGHWVRVRDVSKAVSRDSLGRVTRIIGAMIDITKRHVLEEQLRQAQKLESIGRLAGGVAHDFNNMLGIIIGYAESLAEELQPEDPMMEDVEQIVDAGKRSAALTRQLLAFSRKQTLRPEALDLNDLIRRLEKNLLRLIGEDIALEMHLSSVCGRVMADAGQIEQVIINLAINARDAMPKGGHLIIETTDVTLDENYARSHAGINPGKYVMLALTDTGCGMEKSVAANIFEPFFTTKDKERGTGLGLSTVYGIVKQSGGNIWVYSEPDKGTTFKIYLPQTDMEPVAKKSIDIKADKKAGGEHILVVEDFTPLRRLCEKALSGQGYRLTLAANGREAILLVEEQGLKPDLVISDVVMPGMSGTEMADRLRETISDLKVLYMSGYTDHAVVTNVGFNRDEPFIQKPFSPNELSRQVRKMLDGAAMET